MGPADTIALYSCRSSEHLAIAARSSQTRVTLSSVARLRAGAAQYTSRQLRDGGAKAAR
jgi:hypothetical protein